MKRRKRRELPFYEAIEITGLAAEGKSLARIDDQVVFVPFGAPGDVVDLQIRKRRKQYMEGEIVRFLSRSADRAEPFCDHFGICGGCKWQHLPYDMQTEQKRQQVIDSLERIGGFRGVEVKPTTTSPRERFYRNKLEFTFTPRRWLTSEELGSGKLWEEMEMNGLGFHLPGQFDRILDIDTCHLQPEPSNQIRKFIKEISLELEIPFFHPRSHTGVLRNLIIRNNKQGQFMVILSLTSYSDLQKQLLEELVAAFPEITSLHYVINTKKNDDISDLETHCFHGEPWLQEEVDGLIFRVAPKSFYQTNGEQVERLYRCVVDGSGLQGHETVYDLYTGTGTIALFLARLARKVVGIEYVEQSVRDARENARLNGLANTAFFSGDMAKVLTPDFVEAHGRPDVVVADPPRAGMHADVVAQLLKMKPQRIVYVSCNPATQARDTALLGSMYSISLAQPFDLFPHTHHVENVLVLDLKEGM